MSYRYTQRDLLAEPERYFYTALEGPGFLDAWQETRQEALAALTKMPFSAEIVPQQPLLPSLAEPFETGPLIDAALSADPVTATPASDWLIGRIEVTKRLYPAYAAGGRKGQGDPGDLTLYARAAHLLGRRADTGLRALNALLKLTDILLSQQPDAWAQPQVAFHLAPALEAELAAVTARRARAAVEPDASPLLPADIPVAPDAPLPLDGVTLIAADTTRSRAYIQIMARAGLILEHVLALPSPGGRPGQATAPPRSPDHAESDPLWRAAHFDPALSLDACLRALGAPVTPSPSADINDAGTVAALAALPGQVAIYSGYGGQILRGPALAAGKRLLHIHGGYVPAFRGSTSNYYSMLDDGTIGASAIFLSETLDAGPLLARVRVPAPPDRTKMDHLHDSALRAGLLARVLSHYATSGHWPSETIEPTEHAETFYVIHPVLKHLAVFPSAPKSVTDPAQTGIPA